MKMLKDTILSTKAFIISQIIILATALLFFGGLYYILYQERFRPAQLQYNPVTREPVSLFLEIASPEDDILVYEDNLVISGKTGSEFPVIISGPEEDFGLQAGKDGQFLKVINLIPGPNIIEITAFDNDGNKKSVAKSVFFTEEKL